MHECQASAKGRCPSRPSARSAWKSSRRTRPSWNSAALDAGPCFTQGRPPWGQTWRTRSDVGIGYLRKTRTEASVKIASCMVPRKRRAGSYYPPPPGRKTRPGPTWCAAEALLSRLCMGSGGWECPEINWAISSAWRGLGIVADMGG